ncbi:MAG TPA: hypothetical protein VF817_01305 [Patescibacteria group bacterium]
MEKIELEKWQVEEIGKSMVRASNLRRLTENDRQRLFIEISHIINCFGLYETASKMIKEKIEEFIPKYKLICYHLKINPETFGPQVIGFEGVVAPCVDGKSLDEIYSHVVEDIEKKRGFSTNREYGRGCFCQKWRIEGGGD